MGGEDPASSLLLRYTVSLGSLINTLGLVLVLTIVASLASVIKALRLRPVEAMRHE
jgi:ABC-type lipoprotein release transport system permease subunit